MSTPDANGWIKGTPAPELRDGTMLLVCVPGETLNNADDPAVDIVDWDEEAKAWTGYAGDYQDADITHYQVVKNPVEFEAV